jgi:hypothetical protein
MGKSGAGGLPHLSFVKRKPEPLGLESETVCDGDTGIVLRVEMQEGTTRMARKDYLDDHTHTTASTLRLVEGSFVEDGKKRTVYIGSWCSCKTQLARQDKFGHHTIGSVKTVHSLFPAEAARWTLKDVGRGEHVVFKCDGEGVWAIGWSDVHFKLCLATCGQSGPGASAAKKRQRADGRDFSIQVDRPQVIAEHTQDVGNVELHNRHRQGMFKIHQVWSVKNWQTRVQSELFATCLVDGFLLSQHFLPAWQAASDTSKFFKWLGVLLGKLEIMAKENDHVLRAEKGAVVVVEKYEQGKVGSAIIQSGPNAEKKRTAQERCRCCSAGGRMEPRRVGSNVKPGANRASFCCKPRPDECT